MTILRGTGLLPGMEPNQNPIARLLGSSKSLVVLAVAALSFLGLYLGKVRFDEVESFLKYILITWLGAQGFEDAAKHVATAKSGPSATVITEAVAAGVKKASLAPPPMPEVVITDKPEA